LAKQPGIDLSPPAEQRGGTQALFAGKAKKKKRKKNKCHKTSSCRGPRVARHIREGEKSDSSVFSGGKEGEKRTRKVLDPRGGGDSPVIRR